MFSKLKLKITNKILRSLGSSYVLKSLSPLSKFQLNESVFNQLPLLDNIAPSELSLEKFKNVLVLSPHPDDDIFGSGGTLLLLSKLGANIHTLYLTHGGTKEGQKEEVLSEIKKVSSILHNQYSIWPINPGKLLNDKQNQNSLNDLYQKLNPDLILIPFVADQHIDHRITNHIFLDSLKNNVIKLQTIPTVMAYQIYGLVPATGYVDITSVMNKKLELVEIWKSVNGIRNWSHYISGLNALNCRYKQTKEKVYLETFFISNLNEYLNIIKKMLP